MCFYHDDYHWIASVYEDSAQVAEKDCRCFECYRMIQAGEMRRKIFQQEEECCRICYDEDSDKETCDHDYGETFSCSICRECGLMLEAIYDLERIEGCPEHARQPAYGELGGAIWSSDDGKKYVRHALERFPELVASQVVQRFAPYDPCED